jgi:hypothetical protein
MVLDMREALVSIAIARQDQSDSWPDLHWDDPGFDWKKCARTMERIARRMLDEIDPILRLQQRMADDD